VRTLRSVAWNTSYRYLAQSATRGRENPQAPVVRALLGDCGGPLAGGKHYGTEGAGGRSVTVVRAAIA